MRPTRCVIFLAVLLAVSLAAPLFAAPGGPGPQMPDIPRIFGIFEPTQGVWAEYDILDKKMNQPSKMRMAVVGQEGDAFWYEVTNTQKDSVNVIKMLVKGDPNDTENIQRLIIKSGDQNAIEMPRDFVLMGRRMATHMFSERSGVPAEGAMVTSRDAGTKTMTVPAGTFTGMLKEIVDEKGKVLSTYLFLQSVSPFGIVWSDSEATEMKLKAHGADAVSQITGPVEKMAMPPGMPEGMPRGMPPGMKMEPGKM